MKRIGNIFLFLIVSTIPVNCYQKLEEKNKNNSYIDLSDTNWENSLPINLSSGWEFYWNQLLDPKVFLSNSPLNEAQVVEFRPWTNLTFSDQNFPAKGYATYRKKIKVQKSYKVSQFSIYFIHLFSSSKIYINGALMQEKGKVSSQFAEIVPDRTNSTIEFLTDQLELDIVIQIANQDFYQGGPRGEFLIASPSQIYLYKSKNLIVEVFVFGLIFGSALYHLSFYFINRKQIAFLYFSIVCITFLIRIPFLNSKLHGYFIPIQSFEFQVIWIHYVNIFTFVFSVLFLSELFKSKQYKYINNFFYVGAILALFTPFVPKTFQYYLNFLYLVVYLIMFLAFSFFLLYKHKKEAQGLYSMAIALFSLALFCILALSLNFYGIHGGLYLMIGYLFYVIFQTVSLSKFFAYAIESRANFEMALHEESVHSLSKQRAEMQLMVHDQLGANLTDLKVYLERKKTNISESVNYTFDLDHIYERVVSIIQSLRNQLLYIEDLNLIFENFVTGLHLTLLRRYSDVGREFEFLPSSDFLNYFNDKKIIGKNQSYFLNIFYMLYEVCTNDIKYGRGESVWKLDYVNGSFYINQRNLLNVPFENQKTNLELKSINQRLSQLNGKLEVQIVDENYKLKIQFPA
ncbi:7TM-DISM domain-containing protein [Leptospira harrisiae]|uniref:Signaling protein n=1 Tax=Leptospira harrisiae TaxID=2023189 RepID=A0A2N0AJ09_9LEPT|nr:7TM diverse intracellular signaling domain-containing protein [Leptospira harrisiae]PJZ84274.1 signaling protein [Leptospira harrisiae]PKA07810.1 signaling protein [Leptospira harrisiae]